MTITNMANGPSASATSSFTVKAGLAQTLKGGVIMDVVNAEQARIAEEAGACAVMALERVPADIRKDEVSTEGDNTLRAMVRGIDVDAKLLGKTARLGRLSVGNLFQTAIVSHGAPL